MRVDPVARAVANIVRAAVAWQDVAFRDRAAARRPGVEQEEAKARLFGAVEAWKAARKSERFAEEAPTARTKRPSERPKR